MGKTPRPLTKCNVAARRNARNFNDYRAQLLPNSGLSRWSLTALNVMAAKVAIHGINETFPSAYPTVKKLRAAST
jgi:hypothetical protein